MTTTHFIWPERRRRRRYLTLKNAGLASIAFVVAVIVLSLWSAFRPHSRVSEDLSMQGRVQLEPFHSSPARHEFTIVEEGSIYGYPPTDSLLLDQATQDQLRAAAAASVLQAPPPPVTESGFEPRTSQLGHGQRITITGGTEGVQVHVEPVAAGASTQPAQ